MTACRVNRPTVNSLATTTTHLVLYCTSAAAAADEFQLILPAGASQSSVNIQVEPGRRWPRDGHVMPPADDHALCHHASHPAGLEEQWSVLVDERYCGLGGYDRHWSRTLTVQLHPQRQRVACTDIYSMHWGQWYWLRRTNNNKNSSGDEIANVNDQARTYLKILKKRTYFV